MEQMTLDDLIKALHIKAQGDVEFPASGEDDYTLYTAQLNDAISRWDSEGVYWNSLFLTLQTASTGAVKVITSGTSSYAMPTKFKELGGKIKVYSGSTVNYYNVVKPEAISELTSTTKYAYVTGNPKDGFFLHLNPVPDSTIDGYDIDYLYYSYPTKLTSSTDVSECPDPYFLVEYATAMNKINDEDSYAHSTSLKLAEYKLGIMKSNNQKLPPYQPNQIDIMDDYGWGV